MNKVKAWRLEWPLHPLALASCEVIEIVEEPEIHRVPAGPTWCRALLYWREQLLPLALPERVDVHDMNVVVVAYQLQPLAPLQYAALAICGKPEQIEVLDGNDCELPASCPWDEQHIRACFQHAGRTHLVPELASLFGTT
jgi:chemotaxis signal transduction protein